MSTFDELTPGDLIQWQDGDIRRKARVIERTERCGRMCLLAEALHRNGTQRRNVRRVYRCHHPVRYEPAEATAAAVIQG
jgi:hypothetical protein